MLLRPSVRRCIIHVLSVLICRLPCRNTQYLTFHENKFHFLLCINCFVHNCCSWSDLNDDLCYLCWKQTDSFLLTHSTISSSRWDIIIYTSSNIYRATQSAELSVMISIGILVTLCPPSEIKGKRGFSIGIFCLFVCLFFWGTLFQWVCFLSLNH